jgi:hypothetical protein
LWPLLVINSALAVIVASSYWSSDEPIAEIAVVAALALGLPVSIVPTIALFNLNYGSVLDAESGASDLLWVLLAAGSLWWYAQLLRWARVGDRAVKDDGREEWDGKDEGFR